MGVVMPFLRTLALVLVGSVAASSLAEASPTKVHGKTASGGHRRVAHATGQAHLASKRATKGARSAGKRAAKGSKLAGKRGGGRSATKANGKGKGSKVAGHLAKKGRLSGKHRVAPRQVAKRDQGPVREETLEEIFPPGHRFTDEERAEASAIGVFMQNGLWKDAYKASTRASRAHPDRWWLQAARAAAAANVNRPKETLAAVDQALQTNRGDANRLNVSQLYVLRANALSRLNRKDEAIATFLNAAKVDARDPYSRAGAAWLYATSPDTRVRNGAQALALANEAARLSGQKDPTILDVLAASYAENGDFTNAQRWEEKAILAGSAAEVPFYQHRLASYQARRPWREEG